MESPANPGVVVDVELAEVAEVVGLTCVKVSTTVTGARADPSLEGVRVITETTGGELVTGGALVVTRIDVEDVVGLLEVVEVVDGGSDAVLVEVEVIIIVVGGRDVEEIVDGLEITDDGSMSVEGSGTVVERVLAGGGVAVEGGGVLKDVAGEILVVLVTFVDIVKMRPYLSLLGCLEGAMSAQRNFHGVEGSFVH